jgi:signal transduction histidine kinase
VAHDVLSPLTTTMLSLEHVRETCRQDETAMRAAARGVAALKRVGTLVEGLLEFARAGGRPDPRASAELAPVLGDLIDGLQAQARKSEIALSLTPVPSGSVACSAGVLASLVTNLVQNAIKYMGAGLERRIRVGVIDQGRDVRIEISDTGPGIPPEQSQHIFEPYVQLARGSAGIGLGLATVDRLVRAHGGSVGVHSRLGVGSTFWFELPKLKIGSAETSSMRSDRA